MATEVIDIQTFYKEFSLQSATSPDWIKAVLANFSFFISDHAANERKASATAMDFVVRYPDKHSLVMTAARIAKDEIGHFQDVFKMMKKHGFELLADEKDIYVGKLLTHIRSKGLERLMDRLLVCSLIEMRGYERFEILAGHHPDPEWKMFYQKFHLSERGHGFAFYGEAVKIFSPEELHPRFRFLLAAESTACQETPITGKFH